jgi:hypothetical protein
VVQSGKPKLRHVEGVRSPGGTIQRPKPRSSDIQTPSRFSDSTNLLANALKQRFKRVSRDSAESSPEVNDKTKSFLTSETVVEQHDKEEEVARDSTSHPPSHPPPTATNPPSVFTSETPSSQQPAEPEK